MAIIKICGRCQNNIDCHVDSIENCTCKAIKISDKLSEFLTQTHYDCLCNSCLDALNILIECASISIVNGYDDDDYYMDGNLLVFSEIYHVKRGYCCRSRCRHCPYGF